MNTQTVLVTFNTLNSALEFLTTIEHRDYTIRFKTKRDMELLLDAVHRYNQKVKSDTFKILPHPELYHRVLRSCTPERLPKDALLSVTQSLKDLPVYKSIEFNLAHVSASYVRSVCYTLSDNEFMYSAQRKGHKLTVTVAPRKHADSRFKRVMNVCDTVVKTGVKADVTEIGLHFESLLVYVSAWNSDKEKKLRAVMSADGGETSYYIEVRKVPAQKGRPRGRKAVAVTDGASDIGYTDSSDYLI